MWDAVQKAIWTRVSQDDVMQDLCSGRYYPTEVPSDAPLPYISSPPEVGIQAEPWETLGKTTEGFVVQWTFIAYSDVRTGGIARVKNIGMRLFELFHLQYFEIDELKVVKSQVSFQGKPFPDEESQHGQVWGQVIRIQLILQRKEE